MKTIKIDGREYQIDTDKALELGVLKEEPSISWDEYVKQMISDGVEPRWDNINPKRHVKGQEQYAFEALGKLIQLRNYWWEKWKPDWTRVNSHVITNVKGKVTISPADDNSRTFAFPTKELAEEFYRCHKELFYTARMFL